MDPVVLLKAMILGIVEGLTEFLPISSTGHLIIASELLDFHDEKGKVFEIAIQTGAMLAVVWEYRARFAGVLADITRDPVAQRFVVNLVIAFIPAALLGLAFGSLIKAHLFHPVPVALAFIVGAFIILWVERRSHRPRVESVDEMTWKDALKIGLAQSFALIPGTSRSGATIIGRGHLAEARRIIDTNLTGAIATIEAAVERFRKQGHGQVVAISSVAAARGTKGQGAYSASKAGLSRYLESLRVETVGENIQVTELAPGFIDTDLNRHMKNRPFVVSAEKGTAALVDAIEKQVGFRYIPVWPWTMMAQLLKILPAKVVARI